MSNIGHSNLLLILLAAGGSRGVPVESIGDHGIAHQALDEGSIAEVGLSLARSLRAGVLRSKVARSGRIAVGATVHVVMWLRRLGSNLIRGGILVISIVP